MKRRIAEIVTKFSSEGLAELRRAIRGVADDARRQHLNGDKSVSSGLREIRREAGLARQAAAGLNDALSLRGAGRGLSQIGRGLAQISTGSLSLSRTGIVATTESIAVSARTIQKSFSLIGTVAKRQFAGVEMSGKKAFRKLTVESRLASRVIESDIVVATRRAGTQALGFLSNAPGLRQTASALTRLRRTATSAFSAIAMTAATLGPRISRPFTAAASGIAAGFRAARPAIARALDLGGDAVRAAGRITRGFANVGSGVARSLAGIGGAATRAFAGASTAANRAFSGIVRGAGRMAGKSIKDLARIPLGILREMGSEQVVLYSAIGAAAAAVYAAWPAIKGFGALGAAGLAGWFTMADLKVVRQASEALDISPQLFQAFQHVGNSLGIASEDMAGGLQQLQSAMTAALDPESDEANLFRRLGINPRDASGKLRPIANVLVDIARATSRMTKEQQNFTLQTLVGDAQVFSELMRRLREDGDAIGNAWMSMQSRGLFTTPEEIERLYEFRLGLQDLIAVIKAFARELFVAFLPTFEKWQAAFEAALDTVDKRKSIIDAFVRAWVEGFQLFNDFLRVFVGYDLQRDFLGEDSGEIENTWLVTLKKTLLDIWRILVGVGRLLVGLGSIFLQIGQAFDTLVIRFTGFSIEHWIANTGAQDVLAFFTDLSTIMRNLFRGPFDTSQLETALGRFLGGNAEKFKQFGASFGGPFESVLRYVETAIAELNASVASGSGLAGAESTLGQLLILAREAAIWLGELGRAFQIVFLDGGTASADGGFGWMNGLKSAFDYAYSTAVQIYDLLKPLFDQFNAFTQANLGVNAGTALVLGKVGVDVAGSLATPGGVLAGSAGIGHLLGKAFRGAFDDIVANPLNVVDYLPVTQIAKLFTNSAQEGAYSAEDRALTRSMGDAAFRADEARIASEIAANVEASLGSVDVTATGTPVVINLPSGGSATGIFPTDQADALTRALGAQIGGR